MNGHYVGSILGIKSAVHKKKLAVKAMDIVMFGPPKRKSSCYCMLVTLDRLFPTAITKLTDG